MASPSLDLSDLLELYINESHIANQHGICFFLFCRLSTEKVQKWLDTSCKASDVKDSLSQCDEQDSISQCSSISSVRSSRFWKPGDPETFQRLWHIKIRFKDSIMNNRPCKKSEALKALNDKSFRKFAMPPTSLPSSKLAEKLRLRVLHFCKQYQKSDSKASFLSLR